jgi:hypothetical protein
VDKVALGQVFSEYFGFPCQFSFHRLLHTHHLSFGAGTIGQVVADVPIGLSLTPLKETKKNSLYMALQPFGTLLLFQFLNLYAVRRAPWTGDQPVAKPLPTHKTKQKHNKCRHPCL